MIRRKHVNIRLSVGWPLKNHPPDHLRNVRTVSFRVNVELLRMVLGRSKSHWNGVCDDMPEEAKLFCFQHERQYILNNRTLWYIIYGLLELLLHKKLLLVFITLLVFQQILKTTNYFVQKDCLSFILETASVSSWFCVCFSKSSGANEQLEIH